MAVAVAKCWLASYQGRNSLTGLPPSDSFHTEECPYCDFNRDGMMEALAEFVAWSGISSDDETPLRMEVEAWLTVPPEEQARRVKQAQGL